MVLLKGKDDLSPLKGSATEAFGAQTLAHLQTRFISSQSAAGQNDAVGVLAAFYAAAEDLRSSENEFNARARKSAGPDLKSNLRSSAQFAAIKEFNRAKDMLLGLDAENGRRIVDLVENSITASTRKSAKLSFPGA